MEHDVCTIQRRICPYLYVQILISSAAGDIADPPKFRVHRCYLSRGERVGRAAVDPQGARIGSTTIIHLHGDSRITMHFAMGPRDLGSTGQVRMRPA